MPNPPSIPSHENVFGYEENEKGELIKQKNTEIVFSGVGKDTVGPGKYEVVKEIAKEVQTKGPTWHKPLSRKKALTSSETPIDIPGPGHYNAEKVDIFPIYKYKPSSVFVSKVHRDQ